MCSAIKIVLKGCLRRTEQGIVVKMWEGGTAVQHYMRNETRNEWMSDEQST